MSVLGQQKVKVAAVRLLLAHALKLQVVASARVYWSNKGTGPAYIQRVGKEIAPLDERRGKFTLEKGIYTGKGRIYSH